MADVGRSLNIGKGQEGSARGLGDLLAQHPQTTVEGVHLAPLGVLRTGAPWSLRPSRGIQCRDCFSGREAASGSGTQERGRHTSSGQRSFLPVSSLRHLQHTKLLEKIQSLPLLLSREPQVPMWSTVAQGELGQEGCLQL